MIRNRIVSHVACVPGSVIEVAVRLRRVVSLAPAALVFFALANLGCSSSLLQQGNPPQGSSGGTSSQGVPPYGTPPQGSPQGGPQGAPQSQNPPQKPEEESHGIGHRILFWIPNRIFDVFDVARARVRVGPGWTFSARATELVDINMGSHATFFVGLHGPRGEPEIPWPFGLETFSGLEFSVADGTTEDEGRGPKYGMLEVGVGFQVLLIGVDVGVDVGEVLDFAAGVFLFDPIGDDF